MRGAHELTIAFRASPKLLNVSKAIMEEIRRFSNGKPP
jgi:hypothetical protein